MCPILPAKGWVGSAPERWRASKDAYRNNSPRSLLNVSDDFAVAAARNPLPHEPTSLPFAFPLFLAKRRISECSRILAQREANENNRDHFPEGG